MPSSITRRYLPEEASMTKKNLHHCSFARPCRRRLWSWPKWLLLKKRPRIFTMIKMWNIVLRPFNILEILGCFFLWVTLETCHTFNDMREKPTERHQESSRQPGVQPDLWFSSIFHQLLRPSDPVGPVGPMGRASSKVLPDEARLQLRLTRGDVLVDLGWENGPGWPRLAHDWWCAWICFSYWSGDVS